MWRSFLTFVAVLGLISAAGAADECKEKFEKLKLTEQEVKFLDKLSKEQKDFWQSLVLLLAIAEVADAPKSAGDLAEHVAVNAVAPVKDEQFVSAVRGLKQLAAKPVYEQLVLFRSGLHPDFRDYRPKGDSFQFFTCLANRYQKIAAGGR